MANTTTPAAKPGTTTANTAEITADQLKRGRLILEEIARFAHETDVTCFHLHGEIMEHKDALNNELVRLRRIIAQIGHLADFGTSEAGGFALFSDLTARWLLPPVYPESGEEVAA